jgi:hypothetical protein
MLLAYLNLSYYPVAQCGRADMPPAETIVFIKILLKN